MRTVLKSLDQGFVHFSLTISRILLITFLGALSLSLLLRYGFGAGSVVLHDVAAYSFAVLILLSVCVAQFAGKHVSCDVFGNRISEQKGRLLVSIEQIALLAIPFLLILVYCLPDVLFSWKFLEGSSEPGGLAGYFLVKTVLPVSCVFMIVNALGRLIAKYPVRDNE